MDTHIVIMAGGVGSRLWPVSTPRTPKQFIDLLGVGKTMLQMTADRFRPLAPIGNFWVVTGEAYVDTVREQLPEIPEDHILAEPVGRNTAPCIAYAGWKIARRHPGANMIVTPADALVLNTDRFVEVIQKALGAASTPGNIVTIGIRPTRPETGYGYICSDTLPDGEVVGVREFKEKPDLETARAYLAAGNYCWNAGIFVWNTATVEAELRTYAPGIAAIMDKIAPSFYTPDEKDALARWFPQCEKISIDYAVLEKSRGVHVIAADLGWSDLGNWSASRAQIRQDESGNSIVGNDIRLHGCNNCMVHLSGVKTAVLEGLEGYVVAESDGNLLVCRLSEEQYIRDFVEKK